MNHPSNRMGRRMTVLAIVVGFVAVACGSSSSKPSATTVATAGGGATTTAAGGDPVAYANAQMVKWYAGTERALPTSSPAPQKGKNIWVISCGQAAEGCADPTNAIVDAGKLIGWNMTVFDGKLDPTLPSTGVRNAIAAKADGIILNVVDCQEVQQPLEEAHAAGIKIIEAQLLPLANTYSAALGKQRQLSTRKHPSRNRQLVISARRHMRHKRSRTGQVRDSNRSCS